MQVGTCSHSLLFLAEPGPRHLGDHTCVQSEIQPARRQDSQALGAVCTVAISHQRVASAGAARTAACRACHRAVSRGAAVHAHPGSRAAPPPMPASPKAGSAAPTCGGRGKGEGGRGGNSAVAPTPGAAQLARAGRGHGPVPKLSEPRHLV